MQNLLLLLLLRPLKYLFHGILALSGTNADIPLHHDFLLAREGTV